MAKRGKKDKSKKGRRKDLKSTKQIEPKPTTYRGVEYHSRLEARWAVFLDCHFAVCSWHYEEVAYNAGNGWTYTPDFIVTVGTLTFAMEIKPAIPTNEYIQNLLDHFVPQMGMHLIVAHGTFYKEIPQLWCSTSPLPLKKNSVPLNNFPWLPDSSEAIKASSRFRFDLPHTAPPIRSGKASALRNLLKRVQEGKS